MEFCIIVSLNPCKTQQTFKIPWQTSQIRILRVFLPRSHVSHVFLTYLSLKFEKVGKTQQKFKIPWQTSQIRILHVFLPRSHMSHVFLTYLSLKFEKVGKTQQKFKIPWRTSQIRIPRGRFGGSQSWNFDISTNSEFYVNQWKSMKEFYKRRSSDLAGICQFRPGMNTLSSHCMRIWEYARALRGAAAKKTELLFQDIKRG